ncbi:6169_t:CDS:2 [Cetraspora pellucida]|uniref:6169_t:CDS:1 n=1 Tax=Cetraspora pellucida TaxID=1433469 RepID=A0A9N9NZZ4_9GLOM|nr:6169_t:CDS:2 [Cetraspora pellucida]
MKLYIEESLNGKQTKNGCKYYEEFQIHFWEKPITEYDRICMQNIQAHYRSMESLECDHMQIQTNQQDLPPSYKDIENNHDTVDRDNNCNGR